MLDWPVILLRGLLGLLGGGVLGYVLHRTLGCQGGCPLIASPARAIVIWGLVGALASVLYWRN